jgi:hypothetical protein
MNLPQTKAKSQVIVDRFNELYPVGSKVPMRSIGTKGTPFVERIVESEAYVTAGGSPMVFYEGLSGCYSIEPMFVDYPKQ